MTSSLIAVSSASFSHPAKVPLGIAFRAEGRTTITSSEQSMSASCSIVTMG